MHKGKLSVKNQHGLWLAFKYLRAMTDATVTAEKLLQADAVRLSPHAPFTWASGWKSPIYCDNRKVLSLPYIRDYIKSELCNVVFEQFPEADLIAGVATAGIAWGAMVADQLKLPFIYVRPKPKEHGLGNQIEGQYTPGQRTVVIEDLISTGKSSLQVIEVLRKSELEIEGMVSIFNYRFDVAKEVFERAAVPVHSLTDYPALLELAGKKGMIGQAEQEVLLNWRMHPESWTGLS
jgi:orotate phosphoribosyltransferase